VHDLFEKGVEEILNHEHPPVLIRAHPRASANISVYRLNTNAENEKNNFPEVVSCPAIVYICDGTSSCLLHMVECPHVRVSEESDIGVGIHATGLRSPTNA
jgi:hypothetical protein